MHITSINMYMCALCTQVICTLCTYIMFMSFHSHFVGSLFLCPGDLCCDLPVVLEKVSYIKYCMLYCLNNDK